MDASRRRFDSLLEWLVAATVAIVAVAALTVAANQLRDVRAIVPVIAKEAPAVSPGPGIPPGVVSVPILLLGDGRQVRIGDTFEAVVARLGARAQILSVSVDDTGARSQVVRSYIENRMQFFLVFDSDRETSARLGAIYIR